MENTATRLTDKFRKQVWRVSQDKINGPIVKRLKTEFKGAPEIRAFGRKEYARMKGKA